MIWNQRARDAAARAQQRAEHTTQVKALNLMTASDEANMLRARLAQKHGQAAEAEARFARRATVLDGRDAAVKARERAVREKEQKLSTAQQREKHMELAGAQTSKAAESRRAEELERVEARLSRCAH